LRVKFTKIKTLKKKQKSKEERQKKKTIHYKLGLNDKTKNNETFIKTSRKKNKKS
jgi:hypothetical protein